jgi:hypothetical protein
MIPDESLRAVAEKLGAELAAVKAVLEIERGGQVLPERD